MHFKVEFKCQLFVCFKLKNNDRVIQYVVSDFHLKDTVLLFNN